MLILGISAYYHDSAAVLLSGETLVAAAQQERFSRRKHDAAFPSDAVRYVLDAAGAALPDLDCIVFYDKPLLKFERLLETYYAFSPRGLRSFLAAMPVWVKEKLFLRRQIWTALERMNGGRLNPRPRLLFPEHHLSHAASAFYPSPFEQAAILTIDGVGEWATTTIGRGMGRTIELIKELRFPHSLGLLYSAFTAWCGFKVNGGEYKLMGLAPYGDPHGDRTRRYFKAIRAIRGCRDESIEKSKTGKAFVPSPRRCCWTRATSSSNWRSPRPTCCSWHRCVRPFAGSCPGTITAWIGPDGSRSRGPSFRP